MEVPVFKKEEGVIVYTVLLIHLFIIRSETQPAERPAQQKVGEGKMFVCRDRI
jgi:hypothetical protein